jgi:flagellar assembly protein FliH
MSRVISKENLTAYQRWELGSVDHARPAAGNDVQPDRVEEVDAAEISLPTAEELERLHQTAWQEGYALGMEQGRKAGFEQGQQDAELHRQRLVELVEAMDAERVLQDDQLSREILDLSLVVARQMIRSALLVKEDLILEVIREAFANLPSLSGHTSLTVHPDDAALVREWLKTEHEDMGFRVASDMRLERGSFRFESNTSEMDGTMATRWREIVACLGTDVRWLE